MKFILKESITSGCRDINEDLFAWNEHAAWIFDGATGINKKTLLPAASDARWLVETVNGFLLQDLDSASNSLESLKRSIRQAVTLFHQETSDPSPLPSDMPAAAFSMVRLLENKLEFSHIGDCWLLHKRGETVTRFGITLDIEDVFYAEITRLQAQNVAYPEIWETLLPLIRKARTTMNEPGGYWVMDLSERWFDHIVFQEISAEPGDDILLMTDGFYRLIEIYHHYDETSLMKAAQTKGLEALLFEIRDIEAQDPEARRHPRIKIRDDATAALIQISF